MKKLYLFSAFLFTALVHAEETTIVTMAQEKGFKKCVPQLKVAADFIVDGKAHSTHAYWNTENTDQRMYSSLTVKSYSDGDSHVTVTSSPTPTGKCDSFYIETYVLMKSCMLAREETFKDTTYKGTMNGSTLLLENSGGVNFYLTPQTDKVCLVSKREALYQ